MSVPKQISTQKTERLRKLESEHLKFESNPQSGIRNYYEFNYVIGYGNFGTVRKATKILHAVHNNRPLEYAIKSVPKKKFRDNIEMLHSEIEILKTVDHPNIVKLYEIYEDRKYLHLVMELCTGGDLMDYLIQNDTLSE